MPVPPVDARQSAARLSALTGVLAAPSKAPALVVAAVAHAELLATAPFGWGDGLVARAVFRLLLVDRGLDPNSLAAPEVGFVEFGRRRVPRGARRVRRAARPPGSPPGSRTARRPWNSERRSRWRSAKHWYAAELGFYRLEGPGAIRVKVMAKGGAPLPNCPG
jgi:hypothetical protein